jgi:hypothetical protein
MCVLAERPKVDLTLPGVLTTSTSHSSSGMMTRNQGGSKGDQLVAGGMTAIVSLCIRQKKNGTRLNHPILLRHTRSSTTTTNSATSWTADTADQAVLPYCQILVAIDLDTLARPKVLEHIGRTVGTANGHVHLPHQWLNLINSKNYEGTTAITGA